MVATDSPPVTLTGRNGKAVRARLAICSSTISFLAQCSQVSHPLIDADLALLASPTNRGLRGLDRAIAAHKAEAAGRAPVKTFSARGAQPISKLTGLAKAIAAHQAENKNNNNR